MQAFVSKTKYFSGPLGMDFTNKNVAYKTFY